MIEWLNLKNIDSKKMAIISLAVLLFALIGVWGSREVRHKAELHQLMELARATDSKIVTLEREKAEVTERLRRSAIIRTKKAPVMVGGVVAYVEESVSETLEEAITKTTQEYEGRLDEARREIAKLTERVDQKQEDTTKASPMFAALVEYEPMSSTPEALAVGVGVNLGPFTVGALHPLEMKLNPRIHAAFRF